jgi:hypothetical protein
VLEESGDPMIGFIPNSLDKFRAARKSLRRNSVLLMVRVLFENPVELSTGVTLTWTL